ncbi:hypothetical protein [Arenimonas sp.]|uniref:hypothetical protein n=1 Tax=Arenimonas sp. TaxID=1872635 RepID=UPI0025BB205C|nr:hypothetical protein [Arenimonas sp.]
MPRILPLLLVAATLGLSPLARADGELRQDEKTAVGRDGNRKAAAAPAPDAAAVDPFTAVAALLRAEDFAGALRLLRPQLASPAFAEHPPMERQRLHQAIGWVAARAGDMDLASEQFRAAIAAGSTDIDSWTWLTLVEMDRGDFDAAALAMASLARRWPGRMDVFERPQVWLAFGSARRGGDAERALLEALFETGWDLPQLGGADEMWHRLALRRLADGDREGAAEVVARLRAPLQLVQVRSDRRFDGLVDRDAPELDIGRAAARHATEMRLQALLAPERLDVLLVQLGALRDAGEFQEALAIADEALARLDAADPAAPPFEDMDYVGSLGNQRAQILLHLGRAEEATAQLLAASRAEEFGADNVSQVLNLALLHNRRGQTDAAREALSRLGSQLSPYGRLIARYARLGIALAEDDAAAAAAALAYLAENEALNPTILLEGLVDAGRLDEAATRLIAQLDDETTRADALLNLQTLRRPPVLPGEAESTARWQALKARDDVRAAALRVGYLESHALHAD